MHHSSKPCETCGHGKSVHLVRTGCEYYNLELHKTDCDCKDYIPKGWTVFVFE